MGKCLGFGTQWRRQDDHTENLNGADLSNERPCLDPWSGNRHDTRQTSDRFSPQSPYFYDYLTAVEFLRFYGQSFNLHGAPLSRRIDDLLQMVGLSMFPICSCGNFQKACFSVLALPKR